MKVGKARACISPKTSEFYLIGYRSDNRWQPATGIHDDIYLNALLIDDGTTQVFLCSGDVLEFEEEMAEDVKTMLQNRYGIQRDLVLLSATHNHSSIVSYHKSWYTNKFDQGYYDFFLETICSCYEACSNSLCEVTCTLGKQIVTGYYGNRNHPGELADNEVIVVAFSTLDQKPYAGFINWAVHSTVISAENTYLTSELAGEVSKKLAPMLGYVPLMIVGAAGDCSNRNERQGNDFVELERVATALAKIISNIPVTKEIKLSHITYQTLFHTIHHDMSFVHQELREQLDQMNKQLEQEQEEQKKLGIQKRMQNLTKEFSVTSFHLDAKASVIDLGGLQLYVFPGELGSAFGKELKEACLVEGIIAGYTNGYYEYFMPAEEYGLSFETIGCKVPKGESEQLIRKFKEAGKRLAASKG